MNHRLAVCVIAFVVMACGGCATRASRDDVSLSSLSDAEQELVLRYRNRPVGTQVLVLAASPRWIYRDGVLIDTGGTRWQLVNQDSVGITTLSGPPAQAGSGKSAEAPASPRSPATERAAPPAHPGADSVSVPASAVPAAPVNQTPEKSTQSPAPAGTQAP